MNFLTMNSSCVAFRVSEDVGIRRSHRFMVCLWISSVWIRTSLCESCLKLIHVVFQPGIDPWDDSCDCYAMGTCPSQDLQVNSIPWISPAWIRTFLYKSFKFMVLPWIFWPWNSFVWHFNFLGSLALPFTEFAGSWCPHEFLLRELELFCTKV